MKSVGKLWVSAVVGAMSLGACSSSSSNSSGSGGGGSSSGTTVNIKLTVGSALGDFCKKAIDQFNAKQTTLKDGSVVQGTCDSLGSGDLVTGWWG